MDWTDQQLEIILHSFAVADGGCCNCVRGCIKEFINLNNQDFLLLKRLEPFWKTVKRTQYEWDDVLPTWEEWELKGYVPPEYPEDEDE